MRYRPTPYDWIMRVYLGSIILGCIADVVGRALGFEPLLLTLMRY